MIISKIYKSFSLNVSRKPLITAQELLKIQDKPIKYLTASFIMPPSKEDKKSVYKIERINNSQFFDVDEIADKSSSYPHMLPDSKLFQDLIKKFNINKDDDIVVYDDFGLLGACRAYWMLTSYGFNNVYILDGGYQSWKKHQNITKTEQTEYLNKDLKEEFKLKRKQLTSYEQIQEASYLSKNNQVYEILDARSEERFLGLVPEPRPGVRSGNIPGSKSLPYKLLLNLDNTLKSNSEIEQILSQKNVDLQKHIICSCGSGVSASLIYTALELIGIKRKSVYDGSWAEYGARDPSFTESGFYKLLLEIQDRLKTKTQKNHPVKVELQKGQAYSWCTCGRSENQPFCDGMHVGTIFKPQKFVSEESGEKWLCQCKETKNQPFCDGSHNK